MPIAKDSPVLVLRSVFPDKVGRLGIVTRVDPGFDNPYEVRIPGDSTSRFQADDLEPRALEDVLRAYNRHFGEMAEMRRRIEALEEAVAASAPAP